MSSPKSEVKKEEKPIIPSLSPARPIEELADKIGALSGKQKQEFCKTLTMDEKKLYINYLKERDLEMVDVAFRCNEPAGGSVKFNTRPYEGYEYSNTFIDGQTYTVPLYLAKRMNNDYQGLGTWYPSHSHIMDADGKPYVSMSKKNHRFALNSTHYS